MTRDEFIELVQTHIDEISSISQTESISPEAIAKEADESSFQIYRIAPNQLIYPAGSLYTEVGFIRLKGTEKLSVVVPISDDFVRFLRGRAYGWKTAADLTIDPKTNAYRTVTEQRYRRLMGTISRPMVAMVPFIWTKVVAGDPVVTTYFKQALEFFPAPESLTPFFKEVLYSGVDANGSAAGLDAYRNVDYGAGKFAIVPELVIVERDWMPAEATPSPDVPYPASLISPIAWHTAGACLQSLRQFDVAKTAYDSAAAALQGQRVGLANEGPQVKK